MKLLRFSPKSPGDPVPCRLAGSNKDDGAALSWLTKQLHWEGRLRELRDENVETLTVTGSPDHHPARARTVVERLPSDSPATSPGSPAGDDSTRLAAS